MPEDPYERRRREQELAQRRQEEARERAHFQRTRCISCGLVQASIGSYCSLCAPQPERAADRQDAFIPDVWQQDLVDIDRERDRASQAREAAHFQRTRCIGCGLIQATIGPYCSLCAPADDRGAFADEPEYRTHEPRALEGTARDQHDVFPEAFLNAFEDQVAMDASTIPLPEEWQAELISSWHLEWSWFFEQNQTPTSAEIHDQAAMMLEDYRFLKGQLESDDTSSRRDTRVGPLRQMQVTEYREHQSSLPGRSGDDLAGHELNQHAWLKAHGHVERRLSGAGSLWNPTISLPPDVHSLVGKYQAALGLNDPDTLKALTYEESLDLNALALREALLQSGMPECDANAKVKELALESYEHAVFRGWTT